MKNKAAFTLLELLIVIAIMIVLGSILVPVYRNAKVAASKVIAANTLNQLRLAGEMYLTDYNNVYWQFSKSASGGQMQWWFGLGDGSSIPEGKRKLDYTKGLLGNYFGQCTSLKTDPAYAMYGRTFKPKFLVGAFGFGYNFDLRGKSRDALQDASRTVVFATSAQVNTFQQPASATNPMIEEFYMLSTNANTKTVHYRFGGKAMVVFADGRIDNIPLNDGLVDTRMPTAKLGALPAEYRSL